MRQLFKATELELAQIGFKGDALANKTLKDNQEESIKTFRKLEKETNSNNKGPIRTDAFMKNSKTVQQMDSKPNINIDEVLHYQKVLIGLNYQFILIKTLKYSLHKLGKRGGISDFYLRDFIEKFIPIAYFRIPLFREKLLRLLVETFQEEDRYESSNDVEASGEADESCKETTGDNSEPQFDRMSKHNSQNRTRRAKKDNEIDEWFRIEFPKKDLYTEEQRQKLKEIDLKRNEESHESSDSEENRSDEPETPITESPRLNSKRYEGAIAHIFDWDRYFYSHLPDDNEQKRESDRLLKNTVQSVKWHDRMKKRGVGFLLIVTEWAKYVKSAVVRRNVFWQDVPGYKIIVKAVLRETQKRPLLLYPDALVDATMALLSNEKVSVYEVNSYRSYPCLSRSCSRRLMYMILVKLYDE